MTATAQEVSTGNQEPETILHNPYYIPHPTTEENPAPAPSVKGIKRYTLMFAHFGVYDNHCRQTLFVRKPEGSIHAGLLNLPGGKVEPNEDPRDAAIRELHEETGAEGTFPQYMGRLTNGATYEIFVYRCIVSAVNYPFPTGSRIHSYKGQAIEVVASRPSWITERKDVVPNLPILVALCSLPFFNFEIRDGAHEYMNMEHENREFQSFIDDRYWHGRLFLQNGTGIPAIS